MVENTKKLLINIKKDKYFEKHNKFYFNQDDPKITDSEYDNLKKIKRFEKEKCLKIKLNLNFVGSPPSNKFKNKTFKTYASLANAFDIET